MKKGLAVLTLLVIAVAYAETGSIAGTVIEGYDGPIPGVTVRAYCDSTWFMWDEGEAVTDESGYYRIDSLDPGAYTVEARMSGYVPYPATYPELVDVNADEETSGIDFELFPSDTGYPISGVVRLLDFDGEYWTGKVTAFSLAGYILGKADLIPESNGEVSDFAEYEIQNLTIVDNHYVMAEVSGYVPQYYNHVYTVEEATKLKAPAEDIDFDLERAADSTLLGGVSGVIRGTFGPLPLASVYAKEGNQLASGRLNTQYGTYRLHLEPGTYSIYATRAGYNTGEYLGPVTVADQEIPDINITLTPKSYIEESETVLPDYSIQVVPNPFYLGRSITIRYSLPNPGEVSVKVYDASGSLVRTLAHGFRTAGEHQLSWDGRDSHGHGVPTGIYFCRIAHNHVSKTTSLIVIK